MAGDSTLCWNTTILCSEKRATNLGIHFLKLQVKMESRKTLKQDFQNTQIQRLWWKWWHVENPSQVIFSHIIFRLRWNSGLTGTILTALLPFFYPARCFFCLFSIFYNLFFNKNTVVSSPALKMHLQFFRKGSRNWKKYIVWKIETITVFRIRWEYFLENSHHWI